jgi:hypothetical protein
MTGTLLIDLPLSAYRLHGANDFSTLPSIAHLHGANPSAQAEAHAMFVRTVVWLIVAVDDLLAMVPKDRYWRIFETVRSSHVYYDISSQPEIKAALALRYKRLVELFGEFRLFRELRRYMRFPDYVQVVMAAHGRAFPVADIGRALSRGKT